MPFVHLDAGCARLRDQQLIETAAHDRVAAMLFVSPVVGGEGAPACVRDFHAVHFVRLQREECVAEILIRPAVPIDPILAHTGPG